MIEMKTPPTCEEDMADFNSKLAETCPKGKSNCELVPKYKQIPPFLRSDNTCRFGCVCGKEIHIKFTG